MIQNINQINCLLYKTINPIHKTFKKVYIEDRMRCWCIHVTMACPNGVMDLWHLHSGCCFEAPEVFPCALMASEKCAHFCPGAEDFHWILHPRISRAGRNPQGSNFAVRSCVISFKAAPFLSLLIIVSPSAFIDAKTLYLSAPNSARAWFKPPL